MNRRLMNAAAAFGLTLATAGLVWQSGWYKGWRDARRPWQWATPAPNAFNDPATQNRSAGEYAAKVEALVTKGRDAREGKEQRAIADELYRLGQSAHFRDRGAGQVSLRAYEVALDLLRRAGDRDVEAAVLGDLSETQQLLGQVDEGEKSLREAIAIREAGVGSRTQHTDLLCRLGDLLRQRGRYAEAHPVLDRALGQASDTGEVGQQADCLRALGQLAFEEGSPATARQLLRSASWKYARIGNVESRAALWGQIGDIALSEGKIDEAEDFYRRGLAVWQENKQGFWTGRFLARRAMVALARKDVATAELLARESMALLEASNGPVATAWPLFALGEAARLRGARDAARRYHERALELRQSLDFAWGMKQSQAAMARLR